MGQVLSAKLENRHSLLDQRTENRRFLSLQVAGSIESEESFNATVKDLSRTGFLMDSAVGLTAGEIIFVELPRRGRVSAEVAWTDGQLAGCRFLEPISSGSISAALLGALPEPQAVTDGSPTGQVIPIADEELSPRQKIGIAFGLATLAWAVVVGAGYMVVLAL